jgi:hypothetical protein
MTNGPKLIRISSSETGKSRLQSEQRLTLGPGQDAELWQSFLVQPDRRVPFYPSSDQSLLRFFVLPAPDPSLTDADWQNIADGFFRANSIESCRIDTTRHPLMHATPTDDCVILVSGNAQLLLDEGPAIDLRPLDVVRQSKTNHSWINKGPGPAIFISLMSGA